MRKYKRIRVEKKPPFGKVIYDDPTTLNSMSVEMMDEASDALLELEKDDKIRVILLTHSGDRMGGAVGTAGETYEEQMEYFRRRREYAALLERDITKPIVTYGSGIREGDIVIASDHTKFSAPAIRFGIP